MRRSTRPLPSIPRAPPGEIQSGDYQLEIRKGTEFGRSVNNALVGLLLDRSIDTNDRLAEQATLVAPAGQNVRNGQTFTLSDGVRSVTFEYEDPEVADGVVGGNVEIPFKTQTGPEQLALLARLRDRRSDPRRDQQQSGADPPEAQGRQVGRRDGGDGQHRCTH